MSKNIGLLFDMDGVIVDNHNYHLEAWIQFFEKHGKSITEDEYKKNVNGKTLKRIVKEFFDDSISDEQAQKFGEEKEALYREIYGSDLAPVEGLLDFMDNVRTAGIKMAVGTSAPIENVEFTIDGLNIRNYFDGIIYDKHVSKGKPDPEVYQLCAKAVGLPNDQCIVFEDALLGIEAGKNAGSKVIGLITTHSEEELTNTDLNINNFKDISVDDLKALIGK
ncbi:MAG: HAD family phosphatase [bacterium]|nr:HAD family phosphatase [bacterium]